jgi:hypothetical protein
MLSIKGYYNGKTIEPIHPVKSVPPTSVIITFLDETIQDEFIKEEIETYRAKASNFDFGEAPDEEYEKELMEVYNQTLEKY